MEFMQATNGVSVETELQWRKILKSCNNPLGLSEEMVYESLDLCPPQNFKGARHIGRYLIPRSVFRYNEEEQPRDKNNDPDHVNNLLNDYEVNGYNNSCPPPIGCIDIESRHSYGVKGQSGFNRDDVYQTLGQECVIVDLYDYESKRAEIVARNQSNHHSNPFLVQSKQDYIKEVCNAIEANVIEETEDAITELVKEIAANKSYHIRSQIVQSCVKNCQLYPNFRTYNSAGTKNNPNSLKGALNFNGFPQAGVKGRSKEEIEAQGYIIYQAGEGDSKASWMRGVTEGIKYGVPVWIIGYAPNRKSDLKKFREDWINEFNTMKEITIMFAGQILEGSNSSDFNEDSFPVKFGGFLPQYVKPNPKDGGRPTEKGIVNVDGNQVAFDPDGDCLTLS
tara:strand:- start:53 stop:1231 length:1179 start_codon:yes stop_codon:yes gene_type:complete